MQGNAVHNLANGKHDIVNEGCVGDERHQCNTSCQQRKAVYCDKDLERERLINLSFPTLSLSLNLSTY